MSATMALENRRVYFDVRLDSRQIPEHIEWSADDSGLSAPTETKAIAISAWDPIEKNTLRLDLWTKDMPISDMKRFLIDTLNGIGQVLLDATGDTKMSTDVRKLCKKMETQFKEQHIKSVGNS